MMSELLFDGDDWDDPLLKSLKLSRSMFPQLVGSTTMLTKGFSPLDDDITILYARSTTALMSDMMRQYSAQPTACLHLSDMTHIFMENMKGDMRSNWIRMVGLQPYYQAFNITNGHKNMGVGFDDVASDLAIPTKSVSIISGTSLSFIKYIGFWP